MLKLVTKVVCRSRGYEVYFGFSVQHELKSEITQCISQSNFIYFFISKRLKASLISFFYFKINRKKLNIKNTEGRRVQNQQTSLTKQGIRHQLDQLYRICHLRLWTQKDIPRPRRVESLDQDRLLAPWRRPRVQKLAALGTRAMRERFRVRKRMCEPKRKRSTARKVAVQAGRASIDPSGLGVVAVAAGPSTTRRRERPRGRGVMATGASIQGTCTSSDKIKSPFFFVDKFDFVL